MTNAMATMEAVVAMVSRVRKGLEGSLEEWWGYGSRCVGIEVIEEGLRAFVKCLEELTDEPRG